MSDVRFYGYKHWTLEEVPRCFYVGRGVDKRPHNTRDRNHKWKSVVKRFQMRVEVCVGPITVENANTWEIKNIEFEGTFTTNHSHVDDLDIGCNFTRGGDGSCGTIITEETREKMRVATKEAWTHPKRRLKQTLANLGRKHTIEARNNMKKAQKHAMWKMGANNAIACAVEQYTKMHEFIARYDIVTEAAKRNNIRIASHISETCMGKRKSAGGFFWKYVSENQQEIG